MEMFSRSTGRSGRYMQTGLAITDSPVWLVFYPQGSMLDGKENQFSDFI